MCPYLRMYYWLLLLASLMIVPAVSANTSGSIRFIPFPADSGLKNSESMMFVPGKDGPKIWVFPTNACAYELDPGTGEWRNLKSTIGEFACFDGSGEPGYLDEFRPNLLWLPNFHRGVVRIDIATGKSAGVPATAFERAAITTVAPDKERIWIGTSEGLYFLDPVTLGVTKIPEFTGIWVRQISVEPKRLWINGEFMISKKDMHIESIYSRPGWPLSKVESFHLLEGYTFFANTSGSPNLVILDPQDRIIGQIDRVAADFATKGASGIWLSGRHFNRRVNLFDLKNQALSDRYALPDDVYGQVDEIDNQLYIVSGKVVRFDLKTGAVTKLPDLVQQFVPRPDGFWLLTMTGLKVIPPGQFDKAAAPDVDAALQQAEQQAENTAGQLYQLGKEGRRANRIKVAAKLLDILGSNPRLQDSLSPATLSTVYTWMHHKPAIMEQDELAEVEGLLPQGTPNERALAYHSLLINSNLAGDLAKALQLLTRLEKEYPNSQPCSWICGEREMLEVAASRLSEIEARTAPEDEKLWLKANLFFDTKGVSWNEREGSYYDSSLAERYLTELVERFPHSRFAVLAEYKMLKYSEETSHEGGDNSWNEEAIKGYKAILEKYPQSEVASEIELKIATLYFQLVPNSEDSHNFAKEAEFLALAQQTAERITKNYIGTEQAKKAQSLIAEIESYRSKISWSLTIKTDKQRYARGEPVVVTLDLQNLDKVPHEINISDNPEIPASFIGLIVYPGGQEEPYETPKFVRDLSAARTVERKIMVPVHEAYHESFDLTRHVRPKEYHAGIGRFVLDRSGRYVLQAYFPVDGEIKVSSNEVAFTID